MNGTYSDSEKISYEGIVKSLKTLLTNVGDSSKLSTELTKLQESSDKLVAVWNSETSINAKNKILDVKSELDKVRTELNNLIAELDRYNENANLINEGTR